MSRHCDIELSVKRSAFDQFISIVNEQEDDRFVALRHVLLTSRVIATDNEESYVSILKSMALDVDMGSTLNIIAEKLNNNDKDIFSALVVTEHDHQDYIEEVGMPYDDDIYASVYLDSEFNFSAQSLLAIKNNDAVMLDVVSTYRKNVSASLSDVEDILNAYRIIEASSGNEYRSAINTHNFMISLVDEKTLSNILNNHMSIKMSEHIQERASNAPK